MRHLLKQITSPKWLEDGTQADSKGRTCLLPRACYKEYKREYKASAVELLRLIRNESKVYANEAGAKGEAHSTLPLVWRCRQIAPNTFSVLYAVIEADVAQHLAKGWQCVIPETWLLYTLLQPETLYQIQSDEQYWAWLGADQQLHITPIQGLMENPQYFLDAIGVSAVASLPAQLDLKNTANIQGFSLNAADYIGFSVWHQPKKVARAIPWRQLGVATLLIMMSYMALVSVGLTQYEQSLTEDVAVLQSNANDVFMRQQRLAEQMDILENYQSFFQRFPAVHPMLRLLSNDLSDVAALNRVQLSGALIKLSGSAGSATDVLSVLSSQDTWSEVKFERNIQRVKDQEKFTISMVYTGDVPSAAHAANEVNEAQEPDHD